MSRSYIAGVGRHLPNAAITFDRFHVIQLANAALEEVRHSEVRENPALKNSRWMWLKDKHSWTKRQIHQHHELSRIHLKTGRAFRLKETLRDIFITATTRVEAKEQLTAWFRWARRSKLAPFKKLALTLKAHWDGILNSFVSALSNGSVEAVNGLIQAAKARARGYRKARTSSSWRTSLQAISATCQPHPIPQHLVGAPHDQEHPHPHKTRNSRKSSTFRNESGNLTYSMTARRMISRLVLKYLNGSRFVIRAG